jgi:hypothetical protein
VFAFLLSVGTAYINIIQTSEAILLVHSREPLAWLKNDHLLLEPTAEGKIVLINAGNQTAILTEVFLLYTQPTNVYQEPSCDHSVGSGFDTNVEPAILKSNEAIVRTIRAIKPKVFIEPSPVTQIDNDGNFSLPIAQHNKGVKDVLIDVCLYIALSTPSTRYHIAEFPMLRFHALDDGSISWDPSTEGSLTSLPVALIERTGTISSR